MDLPPFAFLEEDATAGAIVKLSTPYEEFRMPKEQARPRPPRWHRPIGMRERPKRELPSIGAKQCAAELKYSTNRAKNACLFDAVLAELQVQAT